ncbi:amidohydrolase family protein [Nonomuraea sp. NPDC005650]|uniref:amidohydrolase family protein n=1 Tax=Nonomuraea sp. NPDC005650 TaxID=3157045 RepID=UPI0033BBFF59
MSIVVVTGGTLIDGNGGTPVPDAVVVMENGRFSAVGRRGEVTVPEGAQTVDATGKWIVPGFCNGNVHLLDGIMMMGFGGAEYLARFEGRLHEVIEESAQVALRAGVTTVFDTWDAMVPILRARDRIASGEVEGARIFAAGNIVGMGGPFSADFMMAARQVISPRFADRMDALFEAGVGHELSVMRPVEVRARIRDYIARGVDMVKVAVSDHLVTLTEPNRGYLTFSERVLDVITEETRAAGLPLLTHTMSLEALHLAAARLEADVLIHPTLTAQQLIPAETIEAILEKGCASEIQTVTSGFQAYLEKSGNPFMFYGGFAHWENELRLIKEGAPIILGADAGCTDPDVLGSLPPEELEERPWTLGQDHFLWTQAVVEKGMTPMAAIQAATSNVAKSYGKFDTLGSIENGKLADLVLLDADPLADIRNLRRQRAVIKDGAIVDTAALPRNPLVLASPRPTDG